MLLMINISTPFWKYYLVALLSFDTENLYDNIVTKEKMLKRTFLRLSLILTSSTAIDKHLRKIKKIIITIIIMKYSWFFLNIVDLNLVKALVPIVLRRRQLQLNTLITNPTDKQSYFFKCIVYTEVITNFNKNFALPKSISCIRKIKAMEPCTCMYMRQTLSLFRKKYVFFACSNVWFSRSGICKTHFENAHKNTNMIKHMVYFFICDI